MPAQAARCTSPPWATVLVFVAAAALAPLTCRPAHRPPGDVPALLAEIEPLGWHVHPARRDGDLAGGAYLCRDARRTREECASLTRVAWEAPAWRGVVAVEARRGDPFLWSELAEWGPNGMAAGDLVFFGDAEMLAEIRDRLW